jgi:hypothetical protein
MQSRSALLALVLGGRAAAATALTARLLATHPDRAGLFRAAAWYAVIDGVLGLASATIVLQAGRRPSALAVITFGDAVARMMFGGLVLLVPAVADIPITVVPLLSVIGVLAALFGAAAFFMLLHLHRLRQDGRVASSTALRPIAAVALTAIVIGTLLLVRAPTSSVDWLRLAVASGGLCLALAFSTASLGLSIGRFDDVVGRMAR